MAVTPGRNPTQTVLATQPLDTSAEEFDFRTEVAKRIREMKSKLTEMEIQAFLDIATETFRQIDAKIKGGK